MNTLLESPLDTATTGATSVASHPTPATPAQRLALRLGMALIIWSRRTARRVDRDELLRRHELREQLAREQRAAAVRHAWTTLHLR
jgi:hypothetical protein